ncbi:MAG: tetratricopeptide repeat protein [Candidatus Eisenbacteria bacterium]|uniref:Tetratricopeptide repeat protein n=1 Tax=Eiseniibacteriota bacterium TaxID=2212470 RepID=A0A849SBW3_UNCEI|nr:tetratricopeptide repeat protein [Candidatus Eisenbacteria bacterium]
MKRGGGPWFGILAATLLVVPSLSGCAHFVILHDPLSASEHSDLGVVYETQGELELAAREYHRALRLDSGDARTRVNLGNVEAARGRWRRAENAYRRALRDSTTNADAMNNLAIALLRQRRNLDEARSLAERALNGAGTRDSLYRATLDEIVTAAARKRP